MSKDITNKSKEELLKMFFQSCVTGIRSFRAIQPREWLDLKGLNYNDLEIGFSSGQFSHRKSDEFKNQYVSIGLLIPSKAPVRESHLKAFTCFGTYAIVFPLKNEKGEIVNLYSIRIKSRKQPEFLNSEGIYPAHPSPFTKRLFITSDVLSSASLLQAKVLENRESVIALFSGELRPQHIEAIRKLKQLEEIIFIQ